MSPARPRRSAPGSSLTRLADAVGDFAVLAVRPDTTVVEMGLPVWRPAAGTYLATYGAGHANCQAAAEVLGLGNYYVPFYEHKL